jgi:hypothetical protein
MVVARERNGHAIYWNGHLCEGDYLVATDPDTFVLWTRCGRHDVPPNAAREKRPEDRVSCTICLARAALQ